MSLLKSLIKSLFVFVVVAEATTAPSSAPADSYGEMDMPASEVDPVPSHGEKDASYDPISEVDPSAGEGEILSPTEKDVFGPMPAPDEVDPEASYEDAYDPVSEVDPVSAEGPMREGPMREEAPTEAPTEEETAYDSAGKTATKKAAVSKKGSFWRNLVKKMAKYFAKKKKNAEKKDKKSSEKDSCLVFCNGGLGKLIAAGISKLNDYVIKQDKSGIWGKIVGFFTGKNYESEAGKDKAKFEDGGLEARYERAEELDNDAEALKDITAESNRTAALLVTAVLL